MSMHMHSRTIYTCTHIRSIQYTHRRVLICTCNCLHLGIEVITLEGSKVRFHAMMHLCAADLPAHAKLHNMKQFNGRYGCCFYEAEGTIQTGRPLRRFWPLETGANSQTRDSLIENAGGYSYKFCGKYKCKPVHSCYLQSRPLFFCTFHTYVKGIKVTGYRLLINIHKALLTHWLPSAKA